MWAKFESFLKIIICNGQIVSDCERSVIASIGVHHGKSYLYLLLYDTYIKTEENFTLYGVEE